MSELLKELEEKLETEEEFRVDDDQKAEWCLQKIREANADMEKWLAFYDQRKEAVKADTANRIAFFEHHLREYFNSVPHKVTKTQENYPLPSGKLVFKQQEPEYERDDELIMKWMYETSDTPHKYIKTKESLDWSAFKKTLTVCGEVVADENGVVIPGIKAIEREPVFKVEVK